MTFYEFASNSPWLTFFLAMIAGDVLIKVIRAIFGRRVKVTERAILKDEK